MIVVFYRSDGRGFVVWGRTRDTPFPGVHGISSVCCRLDRIVL